MNMNSKQNPSLEEAVLHIIENTEVPLHYKAVGETLADIYTDSMLNAPNRIAKALQPPKQSIPQDFGLKISDFELSEEVIARTQKVMQNYVDNAMPNIAAGIHDSFDYIAADALTNAHIEEKIKALGISAEVLYSNPPAFSSAALSGRGTFGGVLHPIDDPTHRIVKDFQMFGVSIISPDSVVDEQCRIIEMPRITLTHVPKIFDYELIGGV